MNPRNKSLRLVIGLVCLLAIGGSALALLRNRRPDFDRKAVQLHERGGKVMAQLVEEALPGGGRILLVVPDVEAVANTEHQAWFKGMLATFRQRLPDSITVAAEETIRTLPARQGPATSTSVQLTLSSLKEAVTRCGGAEVVVSFAGAPTGRAGQSASLPPMVCFCISGDRVPELMAAGSVVSAVVPKRSPSPVTGLRQEWFDLMYEVVNPETVGQWATQ